MINQENKFMALRLNNAKSVVKQQFKDSKEIKFIKPEEFQKWLELNNWKSKCLNVISSDNMAFMMRQSYKPKVSNVFSRLSNRRNSLNNKSLIFSDIYNESMLK